MFLRCFRDHVQTRQGSLSWQHQLTTPGQTCALRSPRPLPRSLYKGQRDASRQPPAARGRQAAKGKPGGGTQPQLATTTCLLSENLILATATELTVTRGFRTQGSVCAVINLKRTHNSLAKCFVNLTEKKQQWEAKPLEL